MLSLSLFLLLTNLLIAYQCYRYANTKGYPVKLFTGLGLLPYFNLVVWVYLLFLPNLTTAKNIEQA
ncbi:MULTISPECIES: hypothetical protein [Pseudoalteromonas]|uniref:Orphan protein n=2 Tax=Pseudoalteromonas TaxID=53246 RepID=A0AAQ2EQ38_PSEO7|nr:MULTISPECIES: hypothetical protein [Pseudoalteromonas]ATD07832.1 hypothetical protein PPIS_a2951 [Pseudoalteromonas piscicida]KJY91061.1 hypothetical protein TW75_05540 [Pseudoalteromonas piscicida]MCO7200070.1 hypothetical protein [Pseudoalteromonas sp. OANN1]MDP4490282.1 hypothetical protein [Pseudoalteromonas piscicida]TMN34369.1 hypothetical protein CWB95_20890 [Pseudoalteromonas piscicida]|tara:strand:+ start:328 stop:525 length:198 start_codon:yes stop_codon:yes gene_type:complete